MDMIVGEKNWEKFRFAKAEKQYYELLSKDMQFESEVLHRRITIKSKIQQCEQEKAGFVASRNKVETDKYNDQQIKAQDASINRQSILVSEIAKAREHIKNSLEKMDGISCVEATTIPSNILKRFELLEEENHKLKELISSLNDICINSQKRISALEVSIKSYDPVSHKAVEDDNGVDLFASESDEESEEAARIREERLAAYAAKKSKKPVLIAKSSLVLDVKPWDDETDLKEMETLIRKISTDGLLWGVSKLVPVAFGISKLSISCVVEDDKVSIDWLTEEIEKNDQFVQSVDVAAFNKI